MAQSGFTPITLYYSSTAAAAPSSGNLVNGELALNITDGKLYYKDNAGAVQLLANKTNVVSPLPVLNGGTGTTTSTGTGNTVLSTSPTLVTPALGTPASGVATNLTGLPLATGVTGTLPVLNGGTGVTTSTGTGNNVLSASPTFTGTLAAAAITASTTLGVTGVSTLTGGAVVQGLTVGKGTGAISTNTAVGSNALYLNTSGSHNTAMGYLASQSNLIGRWNTAIGSNALRDNTSDANTAVGYQALLSNNSGSSNTASGYTALASNTSGNNNTAAGVAALYTNTSGSDNTATGNQALNLNLTGYQNTAEGSGALGSNSVGFQNTATGYRALFLNTSSGNTAHGSYALYSNASGSNNTACGVSALYSNTSGSGNTSISPVTAAGATSPVFNPTTQDNRFCMGSTAVTNAYIQVAWTVVSDARDKTNFGVIPHGLAFVNKLTPVSFQFKESRAVDVPHGPVRYGFRAQDILALEGASSVVIDAEDPEKLRFNESSLVPILVKAIQELTARVAALEAR